MSRTLDIAVSFFLLLAGFGLLLMTFSDDFDVVTFGGDVGPAFVPRLFLVPWIGFAVVAAVQAIRREAETSDPIRVRQLVMVVAVTVATAIGVMNVGFVFATVPGFFLFCLAFGSRSYALLLLFSLIAGPTIWALFTFVFELPLPRSPWFHTM